MTSVNHRVPALSPPIRHFPFISDLRLKLLSDKIGQTFSEGLKAFQEKEAKRFLKTSQFLEIF